VNDSSAIRANSILIVCDMQHGLIHVSWT